MKNKEKHLSSEEKHRQNVDEIIKSLDALYTKTVPFDVRDYIEARSERKANIKVQKRKLILLPWLLMLPTKVKMHEKSAIWNGN